MPRTLIVDVDGLPVELSPAKSKLWESGPDGEEKVREYIRGLRAKDAPDFDPMTADEVSDAVGAKRFQDD